MERIGPLRSRIRMPAPSPGPAPGAVLGILRPAESPKTTIGEIAGPSPSPVPAQEARAFGKPLDAAACGAPEPASPRASLSPARAPFPGSQR